MGDLRETRRGFPPQQDQDYIRQASVIGNFIEQKLAVPMARLTLPDDLAAIGGAVYASGELNFAPLNLEQHSLALAQGLLEHLLPRLGMARDDYASRYRQLIGTPTYRDGDIAKALLRAKELLEPKQQESLERELANLMATRMKREPELLDLVPGIRLDYVVGQIKGRTGTTICSLGALPTIVIEYGPGVVGYKKIPNEVASTSQTIFIEKSRYVSQLLTSLAIKYGIVSQQNPHTVVTREDGIKSATQELLSMARGGVDIIIASMIHAAGHDEISAGFANAQQLLRPNGLLVIQAANDVDLSDVSGSEILEYAKQSFGKNPDILKPFTYTRQFSRDIKVGYDALFVKR